MGKSSRNTGSKACPQTDQGVSCWRFWGKIKCDNIINAILFPFKSTQAKGILQRKLAIARKRNAVKHRCVALLCRYAIFVIRLMLPINTNSWAPMLSAHPDRKESKARNSCFCFDSCNVRGSLDSSEVRECHSTLTS